MGNSAVAPRQPHTHQVPYMRASVAFSTLNIGSDGKVPLGTLPAGAIVTHAIVKITTAWNGTGTNALTVGTAASPSAVLAAADFDETVVGTTLTFAAAGYKVSVATPLFIKYAGTSATTGAADIILFFVPDNDR